LAVFPAKLIWPINLTPNHPSQVNSLGWDGWVLAYASVALGVALVAWFLRKKYPAFFWLGVGYVGLSLPCLGLTERPTWPVDRYSYLLDMILIGAVTLSFSLVASRIRASWAAPAAMAVVGLGCIVATSRLLPVWENTDTLFSSMERHPEFGLNVPQQAHVYKLWSNHLMMEKRPREAGQKLVLAYRAYDSGMRASLAAGDYERAVQLAFSMEANLEITPELRRERGGWLLRVGRTDAALLDLESVLAARPDDQRAQLLMAEARNQAGALNRNDSVESMPLRR
jgi:hypothetical protein